MKSTWISDDILGFQNVFGGEPSSMSETDESQWTRNQNYTADGSGAFKQDRFALPSLSVFSHRLRRGGYGFLLSILHVSIHRDNSSYLLWPRIQDTSFHSCWVKTERLISFFCKNCYITICWIEVVQ